MKGRRSLSHGALQYMALTLVRVTGITESETLPQGIGTDSSPGMSQTRAPASSLPDAVAADGLSYGVGARYQHETDYVFEQAYGG